MKFFDPLRCTGLALLLGTPLLAQPPGRAPRLGSISFPTSGAAAAQAEFIEGALYLHSFEYESAERAFRRAQGIDPGFAMAYWGEAMTYTHAVWDEQDIAAGRAALQRLGPSADARRSKTPTVREQGYLAAVEALYGTGSKPRRDTLYAAAMEQLVRRFPRDMEAKAFYALALLGLNQGIRDTVTYLRASFYADTVFHANPNHPGAAHYLIHSYDDPYHAPQGLAAARAYIGIAPDAAHAQHMTTHIFLAMGMWDDVVAQNRIAVEQTASRPGHYSSWLVYGLIQQGRYAMARELMESMRKNLGGGGVRQEYSAMVDMRAHYLLHSEDWNSAVSDWNLSHDRMTLPGQVANVFVRGLVGYRRKDPGELNHAATEVTGLVEALAMARGPDDPSTVVARVMSRELGAMSLFLGGSREEAVRELRGAAAMEAAMPMDFGPPSIVEPTHELLGTMLLEMRPIEARREFEQALIRTPARSRALTGLIRAAIATGDTARAIKALDQLAANWREADPKVRDEITALRRLVGVMP